MNKTKEQILKELDDLIKFLKSKIKDIAKWPDWKKKALGIRVKIKEPKKLRNRVFYLDDDYKKEKPYLCLFKDEQGDYYVNIWYTDIFGVKHRCPDVRLTASGGAAVLSSTLRQSISQVHEAMDRVMTNHPRDYKGME